jgi:hypothetical protein
VEPKKIVVLGNDGPLFPEREGELVKIACAEKTRFRDGEHIDASRPQAFGDRLGQVLV